MKIYFVTYGNDKFKYSVKRIVKEAHKIEIFDEVISFSEKDLPLYIKSSPLFSTSKGGGYWLWKPFVVKKILDQAQMGDVIIYSDAGNTLFESEQWKKYISFLNNEDCVFFQYRENVDYGWSKFDTTFNNSPKLKYWAKKSAIQHFENLFSCDEQWIEKTKVIAGFFLLKKTEDSINLVNEWLNSMLYFPSIVADVFENEKKEQVDGFSYHRHDQSILSIIVRFYESKSKVLVLNEEFETKIDNQVVRTLRINDKKEVSIIRMSIYRMYKYLYKKVVKNIIFKL
ncbi:hypothetical protein SAMN05192550_2265 [Flavobacterium glycines]|uniref:Glycosyl transferase n=1 Tax=Flavobacterium glycines TaxID=551990 RepID=A0A1B9DH73_9FLAO|nr:hypothetical protein [Flavobacterium glycines]OCB69064.1 hypothetical protein FBGL_13600 [Flavobacterium glycines]GEL12384.1 hypothetical protein FGL01_31230 [Flavobacterium glycines]SDJ53360.1 hypothetical protein SAMN05192550_2265 [Flavobacterium glycines]